MSSPGPVSSPGAASSPAPEPGSTRTARAVVRALVAQGVRDVVLCPGSRSAPLAYALLAAHEAGRLRLHVRIDERSAAFLALGLTRGGAPAADVDSADDGASHPDADHPVAVVTTSGTAVANLHPAVLEAAHAGRPLVVVTADRPHEMRGTGANQTTDQPGIFGGAVRWAADLPAADLPAADDPTSAAHARAVEALVARAVAAARGLRTAHAGPVHLDVALREPLTPAGPWDLGPRPPLDPAPRVHVLRESATVLRTGGVPLPRGPRTVVVAGDGAGPDARILAQRAGWPLLAEPTSGARSGPVAVASPRLLLDVEELAGAVERVVVLGHPTLSRPVTRLLARPDVEVIVVAPSGAVWTDVAGVAAQVCGAVDLPDLPMSSAYGARPTSPDAWLATWLAADAAARAVLAAHLVGPDLDGLGVARLVAAATEDGAGGARTLVVGASNPIRDLDLASVPPLAPGRSRVLANRGLAGIDGTISTAAGLALASRRPVRALVGDLTFLHDVGGLACGPLEAEPDLQVVVVDDDGGGIFATLEHGAPERARSFERIFGTPQGVDLGALAAGFGAPFVSVGGLEDLRTALARPVLGRSVIRVRVDRAGLRARREALRAGVVAAVRAVVG